MRLRLMAPFRSHFCLNTGALSFSHVDEKYNNFWTEIETHYEEKKHVDEKYNGFWTEIETHDEGKKTDTRNRISFMHSERHERRTGKTLYERIDEDTLKYSLHLLELTPKITDETLGINGIFREAVEGEKERVEGVKEGVETCEKILDLCKPDPDSVSVRVYDNTISIAQMDLVLCNLDYYIDGSNYEPFLDILHRAGIAFAHACIVKLYDTAIYTILDELSKQFGSEYIQSIKMYDDFRDMLPQNNGSRPKTTVLWVTRTLIFEMNDRKFVNDFVTHWLKDIGDKERREADIEKMKTNAKAYSLSWLNYAFREEAFPPDEKQKSKALSESSDAWESMLMSQYFYSALECLNDNLQRVIGRSYSPNAEKELRDLNRQIKRTTATTNLLIISYSDIQKYLKRDKKGIMNQIMYTWEFSSLIKNARDRISLCNGRIDNLHKVSTERSSLATDILLFGIGAVSFISLIISLSQYGRLLNTDAKVGFRNDGPFDFFGLISDWQMDYVLIGAILIISVLTFFYYLFRKRKLL